MKTQTSGTVQKGFLVVNPEDLYCAQCGRELSLRPYSDKNRRFDEKTGEARHEMQCVNPKCGIGCWNTGGHYSASFLKTLFGNHLCTRCGSVIILFP